jgi:hypothetical protein
MFDALAQCRQLLRQFFDSHSHPSVPLDYRLFSAPAGREISAGGVAVSRRPVAQNSTVVVIFDNPDG